jgi:hypothetical protein
MIEGVVNVVFKSRIAEKKEGPVALRSSEVKLTDVGQDRVASVA